MKFDLAVGLAFALVAFGFAHAACAYDVEEVNLANDGRFVLNDNSGSGAGGLSGITYNASTEQFYTVNDSDSKIYPVNLNLNLNTGEINSGTVGTPLQLNTAGGTPFADGTRDQEGIAYDPVNNAFWVANEGNPGDPAGSYTPTLTQHDATTGNQIAQATLPDNYLQSTNGVRPNKSIESLSRQPNGQKVWTANEEALNDDGAASGVGTGTRVRLTRFNNSAAVDGQWVYQTDGSSPGFVSLASGLSDLIVLHDGTVIAMERSASLQALNDEQFRIRLYELDFSPATEVSGLDALAGTETPVGKTLLWSKIFTADSDNFEGATLGPMLTDGSGDYSLMLVADNDFGTATQLPFYALRLTGIPEPGALGALSILPALSMRTRLATQISQR